MRFLGPTLALLTVTASPTTALELSSSAPALVDGGAQAADSADWVEPVSGIVFRWIPPGSFTMGSPSTPLAEESGRQQDEVAHHVTLSHGFWMSRHEVTQEAWRAVVADSVGGARAGANPSHFRGCPRCPVETVSFADVTRFLTELGARSPRSRFRLPTEAEWEYACRAGGVTAYPNGESLSASEANLDDRDVVTGISTGGAFRGRPTPVGTYPPNRWGLYDLAGNVWEWTADWYGPYPTTAVVDPRGPANGELRVIRGGSWYYGADSARCALRYTHAPHLSGFSLGFRVVREQADDQAVLGGNARAVERSATGERR